jgi:CheY-like chemotaxis protein
MSNDVPHHPGEHILIVDDHSDASVSLRMLLDGLGYETEVAELGKEAVDKAVTERPEVAVIELTSAAPVGFDVARRLRDELRGDILLVAYTNDEGSVRDQMRAAGFDYVHVKGHDPFELVHWVEVRARGREG